MWTISGKKVLFLISLVGTTLFFFDLWKGNQSLFRKSTLDLIEIDLMYCYYLISTDIYIYRDAWKIKVCCCKASRCTWSWNTEDFQAARSVWWKITGQDFFELIWRPRRKWLYHALSCFTNINRGLLLMKSMQKQRFDGLVEGADKSVQLLPFNCVDVSYTMMHMVSIPPRDLWPINIIQSKHVWHEQCHMESRCDLSISNEKYMWHDISTSYLNLHIYLPGTWRCPLFWGERTLQK